jgi:uncharacterized membrane protein
MPAGFAKFCNGLGVAGVLAALSAVLAKFGAEGIDSNLATLIRTLVLVVALVGLPASNGQLRWHQLALP